MTDKEPTTALILSDDVALLSPVMNLQVAKQRLREFQEFVAGYLIPEEDYGTIPGTVKPTLFKPGADKLCELYGLADNFVILDKTENFDTGLFDYNIRCELISKRNGVLVATGLGSCNSYESRYRYRESKRVCPRCKQPTIIKGKNEYGGGWLCFAKKGGCGAKWPDGATEIESQTIGRVVNEDIADLKNTILKMAKKRAKIDATLSATRSAGLFTQDMEDRETAEPPSRTPEEQKQFAEDKVAAMKQAAAPTQRRGRPRKQQTADEMTHVQDIVVNMDAEEPEPRYIEDGDGQTWITIKKISAYLKDGKDIARIVRWGDDDKDRIFAFDHALFPGLDACIPEEKIRVQVTHKDDKSKIESVIKWPERIKAKPKATEDMSEEELSDAFNKGLSFTPRGKP